ncbi:SCP2 sterol-binding domain-containing protein [Robertmurraya kyonggiensis]|uniref:SCP2 domain-containing protein n=1 Tax=Robertmurraya kyonggiensis TaxID=1037680 RepID=A0A4U1CZE3_9BACI|nr:SCP2 sterol-binding domain-containing protein [Robertmurraya kyonggiensis]TKC15399.1 hypothetical protein FA727_18410 [Robertmurraya kyonggiensis]
MLELLRVLVEEVNTRGHLASLLTNQLTVLLRSEEEEVILKIENGQLILNQNQEERVDVVISGKNPDLNKLVLGEIKLRTASKNNEIDLKSTMRASLLLESLFILAIPKQNQFIAG